MLLRKVQKRRRRRGRESDGERRCPTLTLERRQSRRQRRRRSRIMRIALSAAGSLALVFRFLERTIKSYVGFDDCLVDSSYRPTVAHTITNFVEGVASRTRSTTHYCNIGRSARVRARIETQYISFSLTPAQRLSLKHESAYNRSQEEGSTFVPPARSRFRKSHGVGVTKLKRS